MTLIYFKSHAECRDSVHEGQIMIRVQRQPLEWILALSAKIDGKFGCMGVPSNNFRIQIQGYAMLIFLPQFRTNVNLFKSVICLVSGEDFLEARMFI